MGATSEEARRIALPTRYVGYEVRSFHGEKIGKVTGFLVEPEFVQAKIGLFRTKSALIPWELIEIDESNRRLVVRAAKKSIEEAPSPSEGRLTTASELAVRAHFGVPSKRAGGQPEPAADLAGEQKRASFLAGEARDPASDEGDPGRTRIDQELHARASGPRAADETAPAADIEPAHEIEVETSEREDQPEPVPVADATATEEPVAHLAAAAEKAPHVAVPRSQMPLEDEEGIMLGKQARGSWRPDFDIFECDAAYVVLVDLPGVAAEGIELVLDQDVLTISGERPPRADGVAQRLGRPSGTFVTRLLLSSGVDADKIEAEFLDGVLEVRIPRPLRAGARRIALKERKASAAPTAGEGSSHAASPD